MSFSVGAEQYDQFMGRYSGPLAPLFADFAGITAGQRALDIGCGPGALTGELARRLGPGAVCAVDPSERFVAAVADRYPDVQVQSAAAEQLPFDAGRFDAALAQLVVHFMAEPVRGLGEMLRVTKAGGVVAGCVWDHAGGQGPLGVFWEAARELDPDVEDESELAGAREGHLGELLRAAGANDVRETVLSVDVAHPSFEDWWDPFLLGVGPAGKYVSKLDAAQQARLRDICRDRLPGAPFVVSARAWAARGIARGVARGVARGDN
ncbi:MAG TPA: methyltransferase domain-containing protein [Solirubrobacteraceae bacterium]|nr:methyltransferase domain-containing protein [Solirubrobacteraceae bacterium]